MNQGFDGSFVIHSDGRLSNMVLNGIAVPDSGLMSDWFWLDDDSPTPSELAQGGVMVAWCDVELGLVYAICDPVEDGVKVSFFRAADDYLLRTLDPRMVLKRKAQKAGALLRLPECPYRIL